MLKEDTKLIAGIITISPGLIFIVKKARCKAEVPLLQVNEYFEPV